jgi:tight adherence protein B
MFDVAFLLLFAAAALGLAAFYWAFRMVGADERHRRERRIANARLPNAADTESTTIRRRTRRDAQHSLDSKLRGVTPSLEVLERRLSVAGLKVTVSEYLLGIGVAGLVLGFGASYVAHMPLLFSAMFGFGFGMGVPHMVLLFIERRRTRKILKQLPDALDTMVRTVKAGLPITQALLTSGEEIADPLGAEFKHIGQQIRLGKTIGEAMEEAAQRLQIQEFRFLVVTLALQQETGGNLAETLTNLSDIIRKRSQLRLKVKALSSEARASAYIVGALPFAMAAILTVINTQYMAKLFFDPRGIYLLCAAGISFALGVGTMVRMVKFEI